MSDVLLILFVLYVQLGVYALWYFFQRRVRIVRQDVAVERTARETGQRDIEGRMQALSRSIEELKGAAAKVQAAPQRESPAFKQARRRGALEMSRQGMASRQIAETLNMRPYEVETLIRMERLRQSSGTAEDSSRHWLDPVN